MLRINIKWGASLEDQPPYTTHYVLYTQTLLYCFVSIHLYSASCSAHQSEALPVREIQKEEQGRPARALCDAKMHHGQSIGKRKAQEACKQHDNFRNRGGEFAK